ncbi:hypothetical protein HU200_061891 [Digitaria exilis]|uniref:Uncharacterized protein n=1 Tax=Digitaria exilis TaxID=1010633 RepID=A0A835A3S3_9POAL|nr:hypothetical protein HU200_061891 [Digitaria exilis]
MFHSCFTQFKLDFSKNNNLAAGDFISSDDISAGGHLWRLKCFPYGNKTQNNGEYVSIFLELASKSRNVKVIFEAFMMGKDGAPSSSHERKALHVYKSKGDWGWSEFVSRSDVESLYLTNGCAMIMWGVIVVSHVQDPLMAVPPSDIGSHLGCLLDSTDGSEVSFLAGGETFPAHRAVLAARSPVLKAQLLGPMKEATMASITLHDIAPATFKAMLRFMYTDAFPAADDDGDLGDSPTKLHDLLAAADRYALDRLKIMCAIKLWENVSVDTIAATLDCAETHSCTELKKKCIDFLAEEKNFKKAVLTDGFIQLAQKFPSILAELREKVDGA